MVKNPPANAGNMGLFPALGRAPGEGNGNPLQYCCLRNPMDRGAWQARIHGFSKVLDTTQRNAGDLGSIPGLGRSPGEGNGNLLQYACLENSMDGGAWWATVHGVTKSRT